MKSIVLIGLFFLSAPAMADQVARGPGKAIAFGAGGQIKMLYDRRQRPQSVYLNNRVHIVFNAGGRAGAPAKSPTKPMALTYDPLTREFSEVVTLGPGRKDHHYVFRNRAQYFLPHGLSHLRQQAVGLLSDRWSRQFMDLPSYR